MDEDKGGMNVEKSKPANMKKAYQAHLRHGMAQVNKARDACRNIGYYLSVLKRNIHIVKSAARYPKDFERSESLLEVAGSILEGTENYLHDLEAELQNVRLIIKKGGHI